MRGLMSKLLRSEDSSTAAIRKRAPAPRSWFVLGGFTCLTLLALGCLPEDDSNDAEDELEDELGATQDELIIQTTRAPDLAIQLRAIELDPNTPEINGCLDDASAQAAAAELQRQFRESVSATAFAAARCVTPTGSTIKATTIGIWSGGSSAINFTNSLTPINLLGNQQGFPLAMATWVSRRFMQAQVEANAISNSRFTVDDTEVRTVFVPLMGENLINTEIIGQAADTAVSWDVEIDWFEKLDRRLRADTQPGYATATGCPTTPPAFNTFTSRVFTSAVPDSRLQDFPERGIVGNLVDGGVFPSRLLVAPSDANVPLIDSVLHLEYSNSNTQIITSGPLEGLLVLTTNATLEDRLACAKIRRSSGFISTPNAAYEPNVFDMRPPLQFEWTASPNITVQSPSARNTVVTFNNDNVGFVSMRVTDADNVVRTHVRTVSRANP